MQLKTETACETNNRCYGSGVALAAWFGSRVSSPFGFERQLKRS